MLRNPRCYVKHLPQKWKRNWVYTFKKNLASIFRALQNTCNWDFKFQVSYLTWTFFFFFLLETGSISMYTRLVWNSEICLTLPPECTTGLYLGPCYCMASWTEDRRSNAGREPTNPCLVFGSDFLSTIRRQTAGLKVQSHRAAEPPPFYKVTQGRPWWGGGNYCLLLFCFVDPDKETSTERLELSFTFRHFTMDGRNVLFLLQTPALRGSQTQVIYNTVISKNILLAFLWSCSRCEAQAPLLRSCKSVTDEQITPEASPQSALLTTRPQ